MSSGVILTDVKFKDTFDIHWMIGPYCIDSLSVIFMSGR